MTQTKWTVWVGGVEVNDYYLTEKEAKALEAKWKADNYSDAIAVQIENEESQGGFIDRKNDLRDKIWRQFSDDGVLRKKLSSTEYAFIRACWYRGADAMHRQGWQEGKKK